MKGKAFDWLGGAVPFEDGDSIASALLSSGITAFGVDAAGKETRFFCGIGACQNCLVMLDGKICEACLTPALAGSRVTPVRGAP